jgi:cell division protein FtsB
MSILEKVSNGLTSGEVFAVLLAGISGWGLSILGEKQRRQREQAQELGRVKFKLETQEATRTAIREEMHTLRTQLQPTLSFLENEIQNLQVWLGKVDEKTDQALRSSQILERTQQQWLERAEAVISAYLQNTPQQEIKNIFKKEEPRQ